MNITGIHPYGLASRAGCWDPDGADSPGAEYLTDIARAVSDALAIGDYGLEGFGELVATATDDTVREAVESAAGQIATYLSGIDLAGGLASHTHNLWRVFVDLGAWEVDLDAAPEAPENIDPMTGAALASLYVIGERLAAALLCEWVGALWQWADAIDAAGAGA